MDAKICINTYDFDKFFAVSKNNKKNDSVNNSASKISIIQCKNLPFEIVEEWLSTCELEKYQSFCAEKRKYQYAMGRIAAKNAIMQLTYSKCPKKINISNAKNGSPIVKNTKVSITHSKNYAAAIAFSENSSCGIDIEYIDRQKIKALSYISLEKEPIDKNSEQLTIAWCMKEALSKALLCGFSQSFERFRIKNFRQVAVNYDDTTTIYQAEYEHYPQYKCLAKKPGFQRDIIVSVAYTDTIWKMANEESHATNNR